MVSRLTIKKRKGRKEGEKGRKEFWDYGGFVWIRGLFVAVKSRFRFLFLFWIWIWLGVSFLVQQRKENSWRFCVI